MFANFFNNEFSLKDNIFILDEDDKYTKNFGKQWKKYHSVQIDSLNNFDISEKFLQKLLFNNLKKLKNKNVLEIGCGAGRFTEHIIKYSKLCISVDMSSSIYYNISRKNKKLILVKSDFTKLIPNNKFDVVICRGVLQHTPNPFFSIQKIHEFVNKNGNVYFDIYPKPKTRIFHPKYFLWRPLIKNFIKYETFDLFLDRYITKLLKIKRKIKKYFKSNFISDLFIPIWDYDGRMSLSDSQLEEWSKLDTLDGLYAMYDKPKSSKEVIKFIKSKNLLLCNHNMKENIFHTKIK